ncbi:MAG: FprA family A-type flavoprotein [Endomicrobium sp.]|nr:FprA family A-type flavoprotein [Endomicrobium sp.]
MAIKLVKDNIYSVGVVDFNEKHFHDHTYLTRRGVTYNSYLIVDEKITLIDTVRRGFEKEWIKNIRNVVDPAKIDVIIINHIEPDHSGSFPEILKICHNAKIYGTEKAKLGLIKYYGVCGDWIVVKSGQNLNIGKRILNFIDVPMIHWPDSMFTYSAHDKILFSSDGFGQHYATNKVFDDEVNFFILMDEAQKYYANILWPFNLLIANKLSIINKLNLGIELIAPSHGLIWRKHISEIMKKYHYWSSNSSLNRVAVIYETMWQSTEKMAKKIAEGCNSEGVEAVLFDVTKNDRTDITSYILDAKGWIFGSSTQNREILPIISSLLNFVKVTKSKKRMSFAFGSYGWSGEAIEKIENILCDFAALEPSVRTIFNPTEEELNKCYEVGKYFAMKIKIDEA